MKSKFTDINAFAITISGKTLYYFRENTSVKYSCNTLKRKYS